MDDRRYRKLKVLDELLKNELFDEAVTAAAEAISREVMATKPGDNKKRDELFYEHLALGRLLGRLRAMTAEATMAEIAIDPKLGGLDGRH